MNTTLITNSTIGNETLFIGECLLVDPDGYPYIEWMYNVLGECVHSPMEQSSFYVGLGSILLYLFGGIPQIIQNFMKGHADGLAPLTLAQWMIGDGSNLLGAVLTGQLFTQILLAVYFVIVDIILIGQYIGYKLRDYCKGRKKPKSSVIEKVEKDYDEEHHHKMELIPENSTMKKIASRMMTVFGEQKAEQVQDIHIEMVHSDDEQHHEEHDLNEAKLNSSIWITLFVLFLFVWTIQLIDQDIGVQIDTSQMVGRKLLAIQEKDHNSVEFPPTSTKSIIGYVIGCIATIAYLGSRIAQIVKNFSRGTTDGMNPILFMCSVSGNILYSLSIFLFSVDGSFLMYKIPWLCSSMGDILLDIVIISQYVYYTFIKKHFKKVSKV